MSITLDHALTVLRANATALRAKGVLHAAVFGSVARGEARPDSDVDILVDIDPDMQIGMFAYAGIELDLCSLLDAKVEIASARALKSYARNEILREKVDAF